MYVVVGNIYDPGPEEGGPTNPNDDVDVVTPQVVGIAVDVSDDHSFRLLQYCVHSQTDTEIRHNQN